MILLKDYENLKRWENKYGVIYKITNLIDGKYNIGQTVDFNKRMKSYVRLDIKSQRKLYNAINKYGMDNFSIDIIDYGEDFDDLNRKEKFYMPIELVNSGCVYNLKEGGGNKRYSEETKKKKSENMKAFYSIEGNRKKRSDERKAFFSIEENRQKMKDQSNKEEYKKIQSDSRKAFFSIEENRKKHSENKKAFYSIEENKKKHSKNMKHVHNRYKIDNGIRIYYNNIKTGDSGLMLSMRDSNKFIGSCVGKCLNGKYSNHRGYTFEYVKIDSDNNIIERNIKLDKNKLNKETV